MAGRDSSRLLGTQFYDVANPRLCNQRGGIREVDHVRIRQSDGPFVWLRYQSAGWRLSHGNLRLCGGNEAEEGELPQGYGGFLFHLRPNDGSP
ncbi:hypothetical protein [Sphingobium chungbukense]|uniref:hypothetical protein n=1 Tax=Sphingobium chungbukense TaxID=56193 RepID=UPI001E48C103|nr:hypothetical protein [Sphingobium chungbukense]